MKYLIAYVPALHKGYIDLFEQSRADVLFLLSDEFTSSFPDLDYIVRKDSIRAIEEKTMKKLVKSLGFFKSVQVLDKDMYYKIDWKDVEIVLPADDIARAFAMKYLRNKNVSFVNIFLRWHRDITKVLKNPESTKISFSDFEKRVLKIVLKEAEKSLDWWRQVGAALVKDERILLFGHNTHLPLDQAPNIFGDPRSVFKKGISIDLSTAEHAEAGLIAEAARRGICLEGSHIYTTDFPCPPCAKLIARSGIEKCYYMRGYAILDGEDVLKNAGVEIIYVVFEEK